jgi:hypothetical protein
MHDPDRRPVEIGLKAEVEIMLAARPQKITFREMRDMGVRGVLVYCADYHCSHSMRSSIT